MVSNRSCRLETRNIKFPGDNQRPFAVYGIGRFLALSSRREEKVTLWLSRQTLRLIRYCRKRDRNKPHWAFQRIILRKIHQQIARKTTERMIEHGKFYSGSNESGEKMEVSELIDLGATVAVDSSSRRKPTLNMTKRDEKALESVPETACLHLNSWSTIQPEVKMAAFEIVRPGPTSMTPKQIAEFIEYLNREIAICYQHMEAVSGNVTVRILRSVHKIKAHRLEDAKERFKEILGREDNRGNAAARARRFF